MNRESSGIYGIIFDLDGVLVDAEHLHEEAFTMAMSDFDYDVLPDFKRKGYTTLQRLSQLNSMGRAPSNVDEVNKLKQKYTMDLIEANIRPTERVLRAVEFADKFTEGKIAVATNSSKETAIRMLELSGLLSYFETVVTNEDVRGKVKPHPLPYLTASYRLGVHYKECLAIDDSDIGMLSAIEARCRGLRIRHFEDLTEDLIKKELKYLEIKI